ncbi:Nse1 non-SMC component of SMC5-6 complex-domain-containing protein [Abortiporus biennis]|nr:Nse1 non-SMC component of SMC5-6 complex-domain-containing protein [Abortiporus biennis]
MVSSNDVQKLFLQAIISRRIVSQKLAVKLWEKSVDAVKAADETIEIHFGEDRNSWDEWITKINAALNPLDLELAHLHDQQTGKELYALVNRKGDEVAQMASDYNPTEIAYFKAIVEQIMLAPNEAFCVSSLAALREVNTLKPTMTKTQAEVVLGSFVAKGWLVKSKKGRYTLAQRTILELQSYLRSTYPDEVLECTVCFEMVTHGMACNTPNCKARLHESCYNTYRRRNHSCPSCSESWSTGDKKIVPVGEAAFRDGQDKLKRRTRRQSTADGSDEDGEGEEDEEVEEEPSQQTQSQPSQSQRKGKGKKKAMREDTMDVDEDEEEEAPPTQKRVTRRRG